MTARVLELASGSGAKPKRPARKSRAVLTAGGPRWSVVLRPACRVVSEANRREHWAAQHRRATTQKRAVELAWALSPMKLPEFPRHQTVATPCVVTLEHVGPEMDGDNLQRAFKAVRDALAALIGVDDGDPRLSWVYRQRTGPAGIVVTIEPGAAPCQ
jgi:hypothetical protein